MKVLTLLSLLAISQIAEARSVLASWYDHGKVTANGEPFKPDGLTAAHKTLPFGTRLLLRYKNKQVSVRINDRGPFVKGRELDLSRGAARRLGLKLGQIEIVRIRKPKLEKRK